jgi:hypothetical protein
MRQEQLTIIVPLSDNSATAIRALLNRIGSDVMGNEILQLAKSRSTHFARFVILDREKTARLLFSSCYAGPRDQYIAELVATLGGGLELIFSHCDDYVPGTWRGVASANRYVARNSIQAGAFIMAFPDATPSDIITSRNARVALDNLLDNPAVATTVAALFPNKSSLTSAAYRDSPPTPSRVAELLDRFFVKRPTGTSSPVVQTRPDLQKMEDRVIQNQMTVISPNKPGFARIALRTLLFIIEWRTRLFGSIGMLPTIHFAEWSIIDDGMNLLFQSNYDGTWENYIDDFIDYAFLGLDAIWGLSPVYPSGGARNIEAFKAVIRNQQCAAQVFYSAYPDLTVQNIDEDLKLADAIKQAGHNDVVRRFMSGTHTQQIR